MLLPGFITRRDTPKTTRKVVIVTTPQRDTFAVEHVSAPRFPKGDFTTRVYAGQRATGTALAEFRNSSGQLLNPEIVCIYDQEPGNPIRIYEVDHTLLVWKWLPTGKCGGSSYDALNFTADPHAYSCLLPTARRYLAHHDPAWRISFAGFLARYRDPAARALVLRYTNGDFSARERAGTAEDDRWSVRHYAEQIRERNPNLFR